MSRSLFLVGAAALSLAASSALASGPGADPATLDFIAKASQSDAFERAEGRLAEHRTHDRHVRMFAAEMVKAHTKTTAGLKAAIHHAGLTPAPAPTMTDAQTHMIADLSKLHGRDFDKTYIDQQVQAHQDTLGAVQGYAQNGPAGPVHDAAQKVQPLVEHHLEMAKELQSHMGG